MEVYLKQLAKVLAEGQPQTDRTGTGTISLFGLTSRYNLQAGFPATTTKKLAWKACLAELLWFIEGSGDNNRLQEISQRPKTIWSANAEADYWQEKAKFPGDLGRIYGVQWRSWQTLDPQKSIDQLATVIEQIKTRPQSRRLIVNAWNVAELDQMALPPCHVLFQFNVQNDQLSLLMYQRSADMFLGVPFNIASYSCLLQMVAQVTNLQASEFVHVIGNAHIYNNHLEQVKEQLARQTYPLAKLVINPDIKNINDFKMSDFKLQNYQAHPRIIAPMAV